MKRLLAILLCLLMMTAFAGCDDKNNKNDSNVDNDKPSSSQSGTAGGFYAEYNSVKIELGADAGAVLTALGTPKSSEAAGNCGGQGTLTKYVYGSLEMYVLKNGDSEIVDQVTFLDDMPKTSKGVTIGDTRDAVISAHGSGTEKAEVSITYTSGNKNLQFALRDGAVVGITYKMS